MRVLGHVSPSILFISSSRTPSRHRRLNSRDRIRTRLASEAKSGVVITYSKLATGQNPGRDSIGTTIDIGPGTSYQSRVVPHFARGESLIICCCELIQELTCRLSPRPSMRAHSRLKCDRTVYPLPFLLLVFTLVLRISPDTCRRHPVFWKVGS